MKRRSLRSTTASMSSFTEPWTWLRKPRSRYSGEKVMPDLPSHRDWRTSPLLLPMLETIPRPVTTARFMGSLSSLRTVVGEHADTQVACLVDELAVHDHGAVGDAERKPAPQHPLDVDAVFHP